MKKFALAFMGLSIALSFAPAAFAKQVKPYKEECAISHGNWTSAAPDSCYTATGQGHDHEPPTAVARDAT